MNHEPSNPTSLEGARKEAPKKSFVRGVIEDLAVSACGLASSAAVAYGSFASGKYWDFAVYTWIANLVIPIGAILCGVVAALGYWLGARWFHHRPTRLLLLNIVLVSLTTYFSIHELNYSHAQTRGVPLEKLMSYPDYLIAVTENMTYKPSASGEASWELGKWGWGVAALQVIGFCVGGFLVYGMLTSVPYCERCSKYFQKLWSRTTRWKDLSEMGSAYASIANLLGGGHLQAGVEQHATLGAARKFRAKGMILMELWKCPGCESRRLKLAAHKFSGRQVVKLNEMIVPTEEPILKAAV